MNGKWVSSTLAATLVAGSVLTGNLTYAKEESGTIMYNADYDTPSYIGGSWKAPKGLSKKEIAYAFLQEKSNLFKLDGDMQEHFSIVSEEADKKTDTYHFRMVESYKGIPVYGSDQTIALDEEDRVIAFFGQVVPDLQDKKIPSRAKIKSKDAVKLVKKDIEKEWGEIEKYDKEPSADLYIYPHNGKFYLAYLVKASFSVPKPGYWHYFVNAENGKIIHKFNAAHEASGTGTGVLGDTKHFETHYQNGKYYLYDKTRSGGIHTYDAKNMDYLLISLFGFSGYEVTSNNNFFTDGAAVDAHAYAETVFDYFKNTHGRNSYDDAGAQIISSVHVGRNWNNAAWIGTQMVYGDGDGTTFLPLSGALDVVGHELAHAVTEHSANLQYQNESGALNESMSDIFGAMIDRDDWLMGEDVYTPGTSGDALRSLSDPASLPNPLNPSEGYPDHYSKRYTGTADNGGVHINSSINNKAAYLLSEGGTHYGVTVKGIGREATEKIYYRALTRYLTSTSNFTQMRQAAIQAATDLYGTGSAEVEAVQQAYDAVGVK